MGGWDAPWHWIVLAILVIALFGSKKLPDAARAVGRSLRIFRTEIKGMTEDEKARARALEESETEVAQQRALPPAEMVTKDLGQTSAAHAAGGPAAGTETGADHSASPAEGLTAPARPRPAGRPGPLSPDTQSPNAQSPNAQSPNAQSAK